VRIDIAVLLAVGVWLTIAPTIPPLIVLAILQAGALILNLTTLSQPEFGRVTHAALTAHITMRIVCLYSVYLAAKSLRSEKSTPTITGSPAAS
jgi:hypothetical protein